MFDLNAKQGLGFKPPSCHEIRVKYLKEIMTDWWRVDQQEEDCAELLVNSLKSTVFLKSVNSCHISKIADKLFKIIR